MQPLAPQSPNTVTTVTAVPEVLSVLPKSTQHNYGSTWQPLCPVPNLQAQMSTEQLIHTRVAGELKILLYSVWTHVNVTESYKSGRHAPRESVGLLISSLAHGFFGTNFS